MKIFSTRNFLTKTMCAFAMLLSGSMVMAQSTFTIDAPASLAGENAALIGQWGNNDAGTTVTGEIAMAMDDSNAADANGNPGSFNDACSAVSNAADLDGKIVLIDRTVICNSFEASMNVSGAIGFLVCANADYVNPIHPIGASLEMGLDMPVFALSLEACNNIKMALNNGETVSGTYLIDCTQDVPENTVWGANGEGDFSEEDNGWEVSGDGWRYDPDGYVARGAFNNTFGYARTQTSCNGAYVFDSDFLDNAGGGSATFGTGECPSLDFNGARLDPPCVSSLTSPVIDLSGAQGDAFTLIFDQVTRNFQNDYIIEVSTDGGTTFTENAINENIILNSAHIANTFSFPLVGVDRSAQLVIRFTCRGGYYYWAVDDVFIIEEAVVDVQGNENFFATAPNFRTPVSQLDFHPFLIDVENYGNGDAEDVVVTASITDSNGDELFSATRDYGTVAAGFLDENKAFDMVFDMEGLEVGSYNTTYSTSSSNGTTEPEDRTSTWEISNDVFAKVLPEVEAGTAYLGNWGGAQLSYISHGNFYHVSNPGYKAVSVRTGVGPQTTGDEFIGEILIEMYEWFDDNGDSVVQADERILIADGFREVVDSDSDLGDFEVELESTMGADEILLDAGKDYLVMAHLAGLDPIDYPMRFKGADIQDNRSFYFTPMRFAASEAGMDRHGSLIAIGGAFDDIETRVFSDPGNLTSYLPLTIAEASVNTEEVNADIEFSIYPNPASDFLNIDLQLSQVSDVVNITLTDARGQVAVSQNFQNVQNRTLQMDIEGLTPGAYVANIRTEIGFTSQKVMIVK